MEINKLSTSINGAIDGSNASEQSRAAARVNDANTSKDFSDKVSLSNSSTKTDAEFAKVELDKANQASFAKLKEYKARISEYDAARKVSPEAARETELGKMLNDPAVWEKMAENMFR